MRKPKKLQPEPFDVGDFLRPTDTDLRSALNSLLHGQSGSEAGSEAGAELGPGLSLVPPQGALKSETRSAVDLPPAPILGADTKLPKDIDLAPPLNLTAAAMAGGRETETALDLRATHNLSPGIVLPITTPAATLPAPSILRPPLTTTAPTELRAGLNLAPAPQKRQFAVRPARLVEDGHSRAEQQVYASLWENAIPCDEISRLITLGFASMGKLTGLSESNARINLRSLVQKLTVDEHTTYNCAESQGRTYRIYHPAEILRRRHQAGLSWVMRRTLAVVFVDPETKLPLFTKTGSKPTSGLTLTSSLILVSAVRGHLQQYGSVDNDTIHQLIDACQSRQPGLTAEQLTEAIHHQALLTAGMSPTQALAFLLDTVPNHLG